MLRVIGGSGMRSTFVAVMSAGGVSLANFASTFALLKGVVPTDFGVFAFVQVLIGLGYGVSNAIFGAPLSVSMDRESIGNSFIAANWTLSSISAVVLGVIASMLGASLELAMLFGASALTQWLRWFHRSYRDATAGYAASRASDLRYAVVTLVLLGGLALFDEVNVRNVVTLQSVAALISCGPEGLCWRSPVRISPFLSEFRSNGRHALVGVISTEATANAHSYLVTLLIGPAAYAPLAAMMLLFRPVGVVIMSLTQIERPRIARALQYSDGHGVEGILRSFGLLVGLGWVGNTVLAAVLAWGFTAAFFGAKYEMAEMFVAFFLFAFVMLLRCVRAPYSVLLQAQASFRSLSQVTIASAIVSLILVVVLLKFATAAYSLVGVAVGEALALAWIVRLVAISRRTS